MSILLSGPALEVRRAVAADQFRELVTGLRSEIDPLVRGPLHVPREKALLSREGGRCAKDGSYLLFSPFDSRHVCGECGAQYAGGLHDRFRLYWYQLWLAERALHAAVLGATTGDAECVAVAVRLLDAYGEQYLRYPNADNVLGPSRPFFSTYLESIWLLQLCVALDTLESGCSTPDVASLGARVRDRLVAPSAALIRSYDEGTSNRQVWNNAALLAASRLLDDRILFDRVLHGNSGVEAHLGNAMLSDGTWYEGENYHLFAHRGLWYCTQIAANAGEPVTGDLAARMQEGFAAPFRTVLPDLTLPSRRDSQYAISIRQLRFAESCELGLARADDERLSGTLSRLYDPDIPRSETGRAATSADVERNMRPTGLRRNDLSWRTLLFARPELSVTPSRPAASDILPAQGLGIIRREEGMLYASLDYGHDGGGHGHPDRLNFTLMRGARRWFDDPGTGSYVDPTLFWYRSTLAHNAPLIDGVSQPAVHGSLLAFADEGTAAWMSATAALAPGLDVRRTLVVVDGYLLDELSWTGASGHNITLPVHNVAPAEGSLAGDEVSLEVDGARFLRRIMRVSSDAGRALRLATASEQGDGLQGWLLDSDAQEITSAFAPGPPGTTELQPLVLIRANRDAGRILAVWCWDSTVASAGRDADAIVVVRTDGSEHRHMRHDAGWDVAISDPAGSRVIHLSGVELNAAAPQSENAELSTDTTPASIPLPATFELGEAHYRPSEVSWQGAGAPRALVSISRPTIATVLVSIDVPVSDRLFVPLATENRLDNEPASINGDSIQFYAATDDRNAGWLLVPEPIGVGRRAVDGWKNDIAVDFLWRPTAGGYHLDATIHLGPSATQVAIDVIVNDVVHGRARRRGQLVLSGARGEFVYLRGDRQDISRLLPFTLSHD